MQWLWCCGNFGMLSQKYHYYFLILAVQLLIYIIYYFPVCWLLISHEFTTFPQSSDHGKVMWPHNLQLYDSHFVLSSLIITPTWSQIVVSCMPHNWDISIWQRTWCKSVECARVHPPLTSVGVAPPPIYLLCWEIFVFRCMTVKMRASFTSVLYFLSSVLWCCKAQTGAAMVAVWAAATWLRCLLLPLWPTNVGYVA